MSHGKRRRKCAENLHNIICKPVNTIGGHFQIRTLHLRLRIGAEDTSVFFPGCKELRNTRPERFRRWNHHALIHHPPYGTPDHQRCRCNRYHNPLSTFFHGHMRVYAK
ncbi:hypothetical protein DPX39_040059100 [Trypanosoma brucei equiperdum]|uniref:Uncharacterized protein n=1 Tax=Trypanosoma brucei equiperdum TaxID=630700 RepID=A0A3L6L9L5_9TRYP|nr:hypothetical protein DPX39_040059100 [Trypanosoma brucei equiperdum]